MLARRSIIFLACQALWAGAALAFTLEVSGSSNPGEMVCPQFVTPVPTSTSSAPQEEFELPAMEDIKEVMDTSEKTEPQHVRLKPGHHSGVPSIGFWGDSHLAAGFFTEELINSLGLNKEDAKPGFLPPTMGRPGVRLPIAKYCKSPGWRFANAYVARGEGQKVGPALTALENTRDDAALWIDFRYQDMRPALDQLTVMFREIGDQPVLLEIAVDEGPTRQVELGRGESRLQLQGTQALSQLKLRVVKGSLAIEGFAPVYVSPARLKLDIFGIPGATARSWKIMDPSYLRERVPHAGYDLVILEYGTNEGADRNFDAGGYRSFLSDSLRGMKAAFPSAQCLLIGPTDRGVLVKKQVRSDARKKAEGKKAHHEGRHVAATRAELLKYSQVHARIADIQKSVAQNYGCGFWDWQLAMGGAGGAYNWLFKNPPLMAKDLIHLTRQGYQESARRFVTETGISEWLK